MHDDLYTAACYIVNNVRANQMIIFHGGALDKCKDIDLREKIQDPDQYLYVINSTQSVDAMINFANQFHELEIPQIFDPGQVTPLFPRDLLIDILSHTEILIGNKFEIEQISKKTGLSEEGLIELVNAIIKTKGADGSELTYKDEKDKIYHVDIPICEPKDTVDATGAGDEYRAGILTGLTLGMTLIDSCRLGAVVGSFVVETQGAQTHEFTLPGVRKRFFKTYDYVPQQLKKSS